MTVREVYEKAQSVEASVGYLTKLAEFLKDSDPDAFTHFSGVLDKAEQFLQEYADKLYDTGSYL